jgi:hypothetical protein
VDGVQANDKAMRRDEAEAFRVPEDDLLQ